MSEPPKAKPMYRTIEVKKIAAALGAEIEGADLARELPEGTIAEIRRAFLEHLVVFFHGQRLTPGEFMAFARRMGRPIEYPFVKGIDGYPLIVPVVKLEHELTNFGGVHAKLRQRARPFKGSSRPAAR